MRSALNLYDANKARDTKDPSVRHVEKIESVWYCTSSYCLLARSGTQWPLL